MSKKYLTEAHITNKREFVENLYNNWSTTYDKEITENYYATPDRVALILKKLIVNKKIKVLDYGCGTGLSGVAISKAGFDNINGVDPSEKMLEQAKKEKSIQVYNQVKLGHPYAY